MKTFILSIIFLIFNFGFTQVQPLEDHIWILDKIVTADSTLVVPNNIITNATFDNNFHSFGNCIDFIGIINYSDSNQIFQLNEGSIPISPNCDPELFLIDEFYVEEFIFDQPFISFLNPFFYTFKLQNNKIYLDITNSEGSVATFFVDFLSQDNFLEQNLVLYPNPVQDKLFIDSPNMSLEQVNIYDLSGKMVFEQKGVSNDNLDVSHLQSGVYILKIKTSVGVVQRKLVKE